jgi:hypothetical protein
MINSFIFTALACEAKAFITQFKLKKDLNRHPFTIYTNEQIVLTITGSGKIAMAAAVAYSLASFEFIEEPVLINVGIAGHQTATLGKLFSVYKITDTDNGKNYYPQSVIRNDCSSLALCTVSKPNLHYKNDYLYEMEASGFYEIATHFTTTELIQVFKIVSDNQRIGIEAINAKKVTAWITASIEKMAIVIEKLQALAISLHNPNSHDYELLQAAYYFNVNNDYQLKASLQRWNVLSNGAELNFSKIKFHHAKAVLQWLQQQIDLQEFRL